LGGKQSVLLVTFRAALYHALYISLGFVVAAASNFFAVRPVCFGTRLSLFRANSRCRAECLLNLCKTHKSRTPNRINIYFCPELKTKTGTDELKTITARRKAQKTYMK
jgi:hypothetical protein